MKKNLVLLGMMGVGKSTLGKIVAKKQGFKFIAYGSDMIFLSEKINNVITKIHACNKLARKSK